MYFTLYIPVFLKDNIPIHEYCYWAEIYMKSSEFSTVCLDGGNLLSSSLSGTVLALGRFINTENNIVYIYRKIYLI